MTTYMTSILWHISYMTAYMQCVAHFFQRGEFSVRFETNYHMSGLRFFQYEDGESHQSSSSHNGKWKDQNSVLSVLQFPFVYWSQGQTPLIIVYPRVPWSLNSSYLTLLSYLLTIKAWFTIKCWRSFDVKRTNASVYNEYSYWKMQQHSNSWGLGGGRR